MASILHLIKIDEVVSLYIFYYHNTRTLKSKKNTIYPSLFTMYSISMLVVVARTNRPAAHFTREIGKSHGHKVALAMYFLAPLPRSLLPPDDYEVKSLGFSYRTNRRPNGIFLYNVFIHVDSYVRTSRVVLYRAA